MYLEHFGLSEHPFRITPHTDFFYTGADRGAILSALIYAAQHEEGIIKVTGEVGSGKTMLCRMLMEKLPENVVSIYLANPSLNRDEILYAIADDLGIPLPANSRTAIIIKALQDCLIDLYSKGKRVVLLVDEAHAMPNESLEEIRLLSNLESNRHKLLQIILFGQQELDAALHQSAMRPLRERITQNFTLQPWHHHDIGAYIAFRLRAANYQGPDLFDKPALAAIAKASRGLTRRINILADKSLLAAYASGLSSIGIEQVKLSIKDARYDFQNGLYQERNGLFHMQWSAKKLAFIAGGLILTFITLVFLLQHTKQTNLSLTTPMIQPQETQNPVHESAKGAAITPVNDSTSTKKKIESTDAIDPYAQGADWLKTDGEGYSIQIMLVKEANSPQGKANVKSLMGTLASKSGSNFELKKVMFFTNEAAEIQRLSVTYGQFMAKEEALSAYRKLPESLRPLKLQIRSKLGLKKEIGENSE